MQRTHRRVTNHPHQARRHSSLEFFAGSMFQQPVSRRATGPVWHAVGRGAYAVEAAPDTFQASGVVLESVFHSRTAAGAMSPALLARLVANEATLKALLTLTAAPVQHGAVRISQRPWAAVASHLLETHARPGPLFCPQASSTTLQRRTELMSRCAARFLAGSTRSCLTSQIWCHSWEAQLDSVCATSRLVCPCSCQQCLYNAKARDRLLHGTEAAQQAAVHT